MFGMEALDTVQPSLGHHGNDFVASVQPWMRHHRHSASLVDQFGGFRGGHFELWHPRRPVLLQKSFERLVQTADQTCLDQRPRDMRPPRSTTIRQRKYLLGLKRHVQFVEPLDHLPYSVLADGLEFGDLRQEGWVLQINAVPQNVNFVAILFSRELRTCNKFNSSYPAGRRSRFAAFDRVMIGEG